MQLPRSQLALLIVTTFAILIASFCSIQTQSLPTFVRSSSNSLNLRPIIGIMTIPTAGQDAYLQQFGESYMDGDYVKWIECGGGQVVPIPFDASPELLSQLFSYINGILFTGGDLYLGYSDLYYNTSLFLYQLALAANDDGDYFPIWGTCQGFQMLCTMASNTNESILPCNFDSEQLPLALDLTPAASSSRFFQSLSPQVVHTLTTWNVTTNMHQCGVYPREFAPIGGNPYLNSFFNLLSTNVDRNNQPFASTIEARDYPIWASQWHPETNSFDWNPEADSSFNHSQPAIDAMKAVSFFFVNETRRNLHQFPNIGIQQQALIYNWIPVDGAQDPDTIQLQIFVFDKLTQYYQDLFATI